MVSAINLSVFQEGIIIDTNPSTIILYLTTATTVFTIVPISLQNPNFRILSKLYFIFSGSTFSTYTNWELIIVDDCSSDNTDEVVASFKDKRIKYLHNEKNSGAALTRKKALREAKGEWIAFLDSDDLWMPEKLEHQIDFMNKNGYSLSFTEYEKIDEDSKPLNIYVSGPDKVNKRKMYNYDYIGQLTMMYNAKVFGLIQIKDIKKNNDYAIRLQLYKKPDTCAYLLKENLAKYRVRKVSISHDK